MTSIVFSHLPQCLKQFYAACLVKSPFCVNWWPHSSHEYTIPSWIACTCIVRPEDVDACWSQKLHWNLFLSCTGCLWTLRPCSQTTPCYNHYTSTSTYLAWEFNIFLFSHLWFTERVIRFTYQVFSQVHWVSNSEISGKH